MIKRFPMTKRGHKCLKIELERLKAERPRIVDSIAEARAHGDLKENAEYHAAREEQGLMEAKINALEAKLAAAHVIDITQIPYTGRVMFGVTVSLLNLKAKEEICYTIVCEDEADIKEEKISVTSPIARALIGKEEGEVIEVITPGGEIEYEILKVLHI